MFNRLICSKYWIVSSMFRGCLECLKTYCRFAHCQSLLNVLLCCLPEEINTISMSTVVHFQPLIAQVLYNGVSLLSSAENRSFKLCVHFDSSSMVWQGFLNIRGLQKCLGINRGQWRFKFKAISRMADKQIQVFRISPGVQGFFVVSFQYGWADVFLRGLTV